MAESKLLSRVRNIFDRFAQASSGRAAGSGIMAEIGRLTPNYLPFQGPQNTLQNFQTPGEPIRRSPITQWFWNPIYGQPRGVDMTELRSWSNTEFARMCIDTLVEEVSCIPWAIVPKEGMDENEEKIIEVTNFYKHLNGNGESLAYILKQFLRDLLEVDAGVFVKNYDLAGRMKELVARDGGSFLKNYDYTGFAPGPEDVDANGFRIPAYWQYSFVAPSAKPIPFLKEEIVYVSLHPKSYSVYGQSVIEVIKDRVLNYLFRATLYSSNYFEQNAVPEGMLLMRGADEQTKKQVREYWDSKVAGVDHKMPIFTTDAAEGTVDFTTFALSSRDMEFIQGQQWFSNIVFASFKLNPNELGFSKEVGSKNIGESQERITVKKAIKPLLDAIEWAFNTQVIPEFYRLEGEEVITRETVERTDVEFTFVLEDTLEQQRQLARDKMELQEGVTVINEVRTRQGKEEVPWGDEPYVRQPTQSFPLGEGQTAGGEDFDMSPSGFGNPEPEDMTETDFDDEEKQFKAKRFISREAAFDGRANKRKILALERSLAVLFNKMIIDVNKQVISQVKANKSLLTPMKTKGLSDNFDVLLISVNQAIKSVLAFNKPDIDLRTRAIWEAGTVLAEKTIDVNVPISRESQNIRGITQTNTIELIGNDLQDYQKRISLAITEGITNGDSITQISKSIQKASKTTRSRATAIARTETNRIFNQAHLQTYKDSEVVIGKEWVTAQDERVRNTHVKVNGTRLKLDQKFSVGGDEVLAPPQSVNCRCSIIPILEGEKI